MLSKYHPVCICLMCSTARAEAETTTDVVLEVANPASVELLEPRLLAASALQDESPAVSGGEGAPQAEKAADGAGNAQNESAGGEQSA